MKGQWSIFVKRWLISVIGLVAVCCLIWFFGDAVQVSGHTLLESAFSRLLAIFIVVVGWGAYQFVKLYRSSQASDELLDTISEAGDPQDIPEDLADDELDELNARMQEASEVLKAHFGTRGRKNLYELPWYLIIGPPGVGKTTLLANSDLTFSLEEIFGRADLKGVGGTRNCDWSFTDEAVFLDTAGRFVTQDSHAERDRESWLGFLQLLHKARPRRPINGLILAVGLDELITTSEQARSELARVLRDRVNELHDAFGIRLPIYLVVTKCDLITGFAEYFADLPRDDRSQVWGLTFDESDEIGGGNVADRFLHEFGLLVERLKSRALKRLDEERDTNTCVAIHGFPWQVESTAPYIAQLLADVCATTRYDKHTPLLRGVYLTSATQDGTPFDVLFGSMAREFGIDPGSLTAHRAEGAGKSYFITDLLRRVVFPEAELAGVNRSVERRRALLHNSAYAGTLVLTLLAGLAWFFSYSANTAYVDEIQEQVAVYENTAGASTRTALSLASALPRLNEARKIWQSAARFDEQGRPFHMGFMLYQGAELGDAARDAYQRELNSLLAPLASRTLAVRLRDSDPDLVVRYEALKDYLSLGRVGEDEARKQALAEVLQSRWFAESGNDGARVDQLNQHLTALLEGPVHAPPPDDWLVEDMRAAILAAGQRDLLAAWLVVELEQHAPGRGILLGRDIPYAEYVFDGVAVGALAEPIAKAYTRGGFGLALTHLPSLRDRLDEERWVLGVEQYSDTELDTFREEAWNKYLEDYIETWRTFLSRLNLQRAQSREAAAELVENVMRPSSPLRRVLLEVVKQTSLSGALEIPGDMDPSQPIARAFEDIAYLMERPQGGGAVYDRVEDRLADLYAHLDALGSGGVERSDIYSRLAKEAMLRPQPVRRWINQLVSYVEPVETGIKVQEVRGFINGNWRSEVLSECRAIVRAVYPFDSLSANEVPLDDFARLFATGGLLDEFYKSRLAPYVNDSGGDWRWKSVNGASLGIPNSRLEPFVRARQIREAFFAKGTQSPSVEFILKPRFLNTVVGGRNVTSFSLKVDGNPSMRYDNGPRFERSIVWPGGGDVLHPGSVIFSFAEANGPGVRWSVEGPWAWLRVLDDAQMDPTQINRFEVTFARGEYEARYEVGARSERNPLSVRGALRSFRCVDAF